MNNFFEHMVCVNLDRRPDKWDECLQEFNKHDLNVERFSAIEGEDVEYEGALLPGAIGNLMSHITIIKRAKDEGWDSVLIFEDDVEFVDNLNEVFHEWSKEIPEDWDLFYLGGNHNYQEKVMVSEHVRYIVDTYTTHAYAVRNTVYDLVLDVLDRMDVEGDVLMAEVQKHCKAYCFSPNIAWQRAGVSDVFNRFVDYKFLRNNNNNSSIDA